MTVGARYVSGESDGACAFRPINEPSFYSWAAGEAGLFGPHPTSHGLELKIALARAAIRGINAIWSVCPDARIVNADPICRKVVLRDRPDCEDAVRRFNEVEVLSPRNRGD